MTKQELIEKYPDLFREIFFDARNYRVGNIYGTGQEMIFTTEGYWLSYKDSLTRKPILITEDGKELFKNDTCWFIKNNSICYSLVTEDMCMANSFYSTREAAEIYLINNSRVLSLNDIPNFYEKSFDRYCQILDGLKQLIKQRLNIK